MTERVRAVLITPHDTTLVIKRIRPGLDPYWVIVGGKVEPTDASHTEALLREIREEIAGDAQILRLLHRMENDRGEPEYFYLARIEQWDFDSRTGPEFARTDRGEYYLEEIPLTGEAVGALALMPPQFKAVLWGALEHGTLLDAG
ncbi:NUDIX domain-containing protein [Kitasatospora sp. NPDC006697]|uniref:NUDIX domain-containing protein n=1 Tax=unclassified Kitasatospora TaxID=2633591 RepID=UPI0036C92701